MDPGLSLPPRSLECPIFNKMFDVVPSMARTTDTSTSKFPTFTCTRGFNELKCTFVQLVSGPHPVSKGFSLMVLSQSVVAVATIVLLTIAVTAQCSIRVAVITLCRLEGGSHCVRGSLSWTWGGRRRDGEMFGVCHDPPQPVKAKPRVNHAPTTTQPEPNTNCPMCGRSPLARSEVRLPPLDPDVMPTNLLILQNSMFL